MSCERYPLESLRGLFTWEVFTWEFKRFLHLIGFLWELLTSELFLWNFLTSFHFEVLLVLWFEVFTLKFYLCFALKGSLESSLASLSLSSETLTVICPSVTCPLYNNFWGFFTWEAFHLRAVPLRVLHFWVWEVCSSFHLRVWEGCSLERFPVRVLHLRVWEGCSLERFPVRVLHLRVWEGCSLERCPQLRGIHCWV